MASNVMAPTNGSGGLVKSARELRFEKRVQRQEIEDAKAKDIADAKLRVAEFRDFQVFPKLPPELRLMIWKRACFPRILFIFGPQRFSTSLIKDSFAVPAVLRVCREAREEALKNYCAVKTVNSFKDDSSPYPRRAEEDFTLRKNLIFFYYGEMDTIYIPESSDRFSKACKTMLDDYGHWTQFDGRLIFYITDRLQHVAFEDCRDRWIWTAQQLSDKFERIFAFQNLKEVTMLIPKNSHYKMWNAQSVEFADISNSEDHEEKAKTVKETYNTYVKREQEKRGPAWKAPNLIVKRLVVENKQDPYFAYKRQPFMLSQLR